jgi:hypothetical protein
MNANEHAIDKLAEAVRRYLREHPNAADTVEGIAEWWLPGGADGGCLSNVQGAVERLVKRGEMVRRILGDGTAIYERNKR